MFPLLYIFTENLDDDLGKSLTGNPFTQSQFVPHSHAHTRVNPDIVRMSKISHFFHAKDYRHLLLVRQASASTASYASLISDENKFMFFVADDTGYELAKVLSSKIVELEG
jgi:hypothetical protein